GSFLQQVIGSVLSLGVTTAIYLSNLRSGGSVRFNVSPAPHQDLPFERTGEGELQKRTSKRLESAVPPMAPNESQDYVASRREDLVQVREAITNTLENLDVPAPKKDSSQDTLSFPQEKMHWKKDRPRNFAPIRMPDPNRKYRYDHITGKL